MTNYRHINLKNNTKASELICELLLKERDLDNYVESLYDNESNIELIAQLLLLIKDYEKELEQLNEMILTKHSMAV